MGVVKNLMVRIVGDASGIVKAMKNAGSATLKASEKIKNSSANMKRSVKDSFSGSRMSVRQYSEYVAKTKQDHETATQNVERLSDKVGQMQSVYDSIKTATAGLDLSKPLEEMIVEAEKNLTQIESRARKVEKALASLSNSRGGGNSKKTTALQAELKTLSEKSQFAVMRLEHLNQVADKIGTKNIKFASNAGLKQLETEIHTVQNELNGAQLVAIETGQKLQSMGIGVSFGDRIKAELEKIKISARSIPSAFQAAGTDASAGVMRIVRSIKAIPANALGLVSRGLTGVSNAIRAIPDIPGRIWNGIRRIGSTAKAAASAGVRELGVRLKSLGAGALRGIASLPGKLLGIGKSASAGCGGLNRMVRSIRNIGIVSLGMRVASGMFGQLRSIISSYIYQNEALNASVTSLRNQFGEALAPAINIVLTALQRLMPIVIAVSNAINSIFTALFGKVASTTSAIKSSANAAGSAASSLETYGFDQITKVSDSSGGGGSGSSGASAIESEQSGLVQKLTAWIQQLKTAFVAGDWQGLGKIVGDGLNNAIDSINAVDIGSKAGTIANNVVTVLHSAFSTANFTGVGEKAGQMLTTAMEQVNWTKAGDTIGKALMALPSIAVGFVQQTNWSTVGESVSQMLGGALSSVGNWIQSVNWLNLGESIWNLIAGIDYTSVAEGLFSFLGSALAVGPRLLQGFIDGVVTSVKDYFSEKINEAGGNVADGLLKGIGDGLLNISTWIVDNIFTPFMDGLKGVFGIHSPSTVMEKQGGFIIQGLLNGITKLWKKITSFFGTGLSGIKKTITTSWENVKKGTSTAWNNVKDTIGDAWDSIKTTASSLGSDIEKSVSTTWNSVKSHISNSLNDSKSTAQKQWENIKSSTTDAGRSIAGSVSEKWTNVKDSISSNLSTARTTSSTEWASMDSTTETTGARIKHAVSTAWKNAKDQIVSNLTTARSSAATTWGSMKSDATSSTSSMSTKVQSAFTDMKDGAVSAFSGLWSGVRGWINRVIGGVESMVNFIIRGVNKMIDAFNKVAEVGDSVGINLSISRISEVSLPRLAKGAVVDGATTAVIGEAGKEAVVPLERNTGWMDTFAKRLIELGGGANGATIILQLMIGNRKLTEYIIKDINQITKSTGVCPIKV